MDASGKYYAHSFGRALLRFCGRIVHFRLVRRHKDTRILVILHLFYMPSWVEIREYLKNLSPYNYSLIVTCMEGFYEEDTLSQVQQFKKDARIIRCENVGWDVLPFLNTLHSVDLADYDIVFKLQSKGTKRLETFLYGQYFRTRGWFLNLFEGCIGPFTVHTTIASLMDERKRIGLVAARNLIVEDPVHKRHMVEQALTELGLPVPNDYRFIAGTCFAIRAKLLESIQKLDIDAEKFKSTGFSFAHRMERIICFPPLWEGLRMTGPTVLAIRRSCWFIRPYAWWWRKYNGARVLQDPRVHIDDEFAFVCIEPRLIKSWEFVDIRVGDIKRKLFPKENTLVSLAETLPYKYLVTRDPATYRAYCEYNHTVWKSDQMSQERFDALIRSLEKDGDTQEKNIVLLDDNLIFDGQHRCCWLLYAKGADYVINALRIHEYFPSRFSEIINSLQYRFRGYKHF